jgi:hypothetical protein
MSALFGACFVLDGIDRSSLILMTKSVDPVGKLFLGDHPSDNQSWRLLIGGSSFQGRCPASEVNDGCSPGNPDHLNQAQFEGIPPGQAKGRIANATQDVPLDPATQQRSIRFMSESLTVN